MKLNITNIAQTKGFAMLVALLAIPLYEAEAAWEIQQFEVFAGAPYTRSDGVVDAIGYDWAEAEDWFPSFDKAEVEAAFNAAAKWYSDRGFPEPRLEPIVDTPNGKAYRVYVCTEAWWGSMQLSQLVQEASSLLSGAKAHQNHWSACGRSLGSSRSIWAAYSGRCAATIGARPLFFINADGPAFRNGRLTAEGYQTVAHELFHAIQANTVLGKSPNPCKLGNWIGEGLADAIGMDILDDIWSSVPQPRTDSWISKRWGIRPYSDIIAHDPSGYPVSSFWSFLDGLNGGYDFLLTAKDGTPGVLDFEVEKAGSWQSETMWLDSGLYTNFDTRLNELLGLFMNDFSMRVPPMRWSSGDAEQDLPRWVKAIWGECEEISLSGRKTNHIFSRNIAPVAGDCAWLTVNVPQATVQVSLQTETDDVSVFKDIWIGLAEGNTILADATSAGPSPQNPDKTIGIWPNFTVRTGFPTLLTFTNAADDPEFSKRRVVIFDISMNGSTNNLSGAAPAGPGKAAPPAAIPSYKRKTQTLRRKKAATSNMVNAQIRLDKDTLSPYAANSTSIGIRPNEPDCREPFRYEACGPEVSLNIQLSPGTWGTLGQTSGTGGGAGQLMSTLAGQATASPETSVGSMAQMGLKLESIDASAITIKIPFVDYGFSGTISNAMIATTVDGQWMSSVGPMDENYQPPLIGSVTVEEFSPMRMRGSYSASLAWYEAHPDPNEPPIYNSGPTMTGTFNQVAPWLSDQRIAHIPLQSKQEKFDESLRAFGLSASKVRELQEKKKQAEAAAASGSEAGGDGGSLDGECNCDCAFKGTVDDLCDFFCEEQFADCPE